MVAAISRFPHRNDRQRVAEPRPARRVAALRKTHAVRYASCSDKRMRNIKLTGREASVVRAIGFAEAMIGTEIQDQTRMEPDDLTDTLNSLMSAGFVECVPFAEEVQLAEMPVTSFELNPAYSHELKDALYRR